MKDGIVLHPEHGLNPSIELCIVCGEEMGIALLRNKSIVIKSRKQYVYVILVFSFLLKGAPACEGMRSLYLYNA